MRTASDQVQEALYSVFALLNIGRWTLKELNDFKCNVQSSEQRIVQRFALFWNFKQRSMVIVTDFTGQSIGSIFKGPVGSSETSVSNHYSTLRKIQKSAEFVRASLVVGN
jgi:hypothetical protein